MAEVLSGYKNVIYTDKTSEPHQCFIYRRFIAPCNRMPLNVEESGVLLTIDHIHDCVQSLCADELKRALVLFRELFWQRTPPTRLVCCVESGTAEGTGLECSYSRGAPAEEG